MHEIIKMSLLRMCRFRIIFLPGTGPQTRGIISNMAEHDGSSKHS